MAKYTPEQLTAAKQWASDYTSGHVYVLLAALKAPEQERDDGEKMSQALKAALLKAEAYISALEKAGDWMS